MDKKYALLDTDFLYKTHLARTVDGHTLAEIIIKFQDYEFFCHEMIREELTRHQIHPDPNPWLEEKIQNEEIKIYTDYDIINKLSNLYGEYAINMYLTLLETSCQIFDRGFFDKYYNSLKNIENVDVFLSSLKECDQKIPHQTGLGEKKTYVLVQLMDIIYSNKVYVFCSDDYKARQSVASLTKPVYCISILGIFYKLMKMGYKKSDIQEYYRHLTSFLKGQTEYKVWNSAGHQRVKVLMQQVLDEIYENKFQLLKNGDLQYIVEKEEIK